MRLLITAGLLAALSCSMAFAKDADPPTAGWIERAVLFPAELKMHAKLDTGADTSSINAIKTETYIHDGANWIRFKLTNRDGRAITIEQPVIRTTTIKRHFSGSQERPVIELDICVGNVRRTVEVNLVDRSGLEYQLLIGRNFLRGALLVDSAKTYRLNPDCPRN